MRPDADLLIIQPYVPHYRVPFFRGLVENLAASGIRCRVAAASPGPQQRLRGDAAQEWWMLPQGRSEIVLRGRALSARGSRRSRRLADAVVTGLSATTPDTWAALTERIPRGTPVGVWGHVKNYVGSPSGRAERLRRWQARHADRVFAYTPGGADQARRWGVPDARITTVMNTVDIDEITNAVAATTAEQIESFRRQHDLLGRPTAAYVGGLDGVKRIGLLAEALEHLWRTDPSFRLILGGRGADRPLLDEAVRRGQVIDLGFVGAREKALVGGAATALAMPGRIGLVAVEALALRLPVVTLHDAVHAPEREYLTDPWIKVVQDGGPARYGDELLAAVSCPPGDPACPPPPVPSLDDMVARFASGCRSLLERA